MSLGKWLFATWYDLLNTAVEWRLTQFRLQTAGKASGNVLEIGGGTGANLPFYPPDSNVTFIEPDPHMRRKLRRKAIKIGRTIRIVSSYGERLPFPDATFDSVVTTLVLCMVEDLQRVIEEARRVLKPGGCFYFYEHVVSPREAGRVWQDRLNPVWKFVTTGCNLNRDITGAITSAGFQDVEMRSFDLSVGLPVSIPNIIGVARA